MLNKHTIGILGGMGPAASANFLRLLVREFNNAGARTDSDFPRMIMLSLPLDDWGTTGAKDKESVEKQIKESLVWFSRQDVDLIAVPCNTVHEFISHDNRVVNIIDATLRECSNHKAPIGVLCSRQTRDLALYERPHWKNEIRYFADQGEVDGIIGNVMAGKHEDISDLIDQALDMKCKTVVLGCTELSLCSRKHNMYQVPVVDSTACLARAVVRAASAL